MIRLFLFCFILLFCSSCTSPVQEESSIIIAANHLTIDPTVTPSLDMQNEFTRFRTMCESEDDYYFQCSADSFIRYYDKASGISGVLCSRPECTHTTSDCNAYANVSRGFMWYDNKLYWAQHAEDDNAIDLFCMNPDGTRRQHVQTLPVNSYSSNCVVRLHRDYIYVGMIENTSKDGQAVCVFSLYRQQLSSPTPQLQCIAQLICDNGSFDYYYQIIDQQLYLSLSHNTFHDSSMQTQLTLYTYDISADSLQQLGETCYTDWMLSDFYVYNNIPHLALYQNNNIFRVERFNVETSSFETAFQTELDHAIYPSLGDGVAVGYAVIDHVPRYVITDYSGQILRQGELPSFEKPSDFLTLSIMGANETRVLMALQDLRTRSTLLFELPTDPAQEIQGLYP